MVNCILFVVSRLEVVKLQLAEPSQTVDHMPGLTTRFGTANRGLDFDLSRLRAGVTATLARCDDQVPRDRPSLEDTCSRLTDEWWNICSSCWTRDPSRRPSMLTVIEEIRNLQVHHPYEFPTPRDFLPVPFSCRLRPSLHQTATT